MQSKVYLAKSARANPDHVSAVRTLLSKFDTEVVEFTGGKYSHKPLLSCDTLIIVPDLTTDYDDYCVGLGKGLHEQYFAFKGQNRNSSDILIVSGIRSTDKPYQEELEVSGIEEIETADEDDYVNYSVAYFEGDSEVALSILLESRFGIPNEDDKSNSNYLLI